MLFTITDFAKLRQIAHIIWDIDGTITDTDGELSGQVGIRIINLALNDGVYHSFITGRDATWIRECIIEPMSRFYNFPKVVNNLIFWAEVGCLMVKPDATGQVTIEANPRIKDHPLATNEKEIRTKLRSLAYDPAKLPKYARGVKVHESQTVIYDAGSKKRRQGYIINPTKDVPLCRPYIWSMDKEIFATFEKIRDENGGIRSFDQQPFIKVVTDMVQEQEFADDIGVEEISTAINIVPKVNGEKFGKSWAAGRALEYLQREKLGGVKGMDTITGSTIAAGDGKADFDFTIPTFSREILKHLAVNHRTIPFIFVGDVGHDLPLQGDPRLKNILISTTGTSVPVYQPKRDNPERGSIEFEPAKGAIVISDVLDYLKQWQHFSPF